MAVVNFFGKAVSYPSGFRKATSLDLFPGCHVMIDLRQVHDRSSVMEDLIQSGHKLQAAKLLHARKTSKKETLLLFEFIANIGGHNGEGRGEDGKCWELFAMDDCFSVLKGSSRSFSEGDCVKIKDVGTIVQIVKYIGDSVIVLIGEGKGDFSVDGRHPKKSCLIVDSQSLEGV